MPRDTVTAPARGGRGSLARLTRERLEPLWGRKDIPVARLAGALGVSRQALHHHARKLGLPPRGAAQVTQRKGDDALFARMWRAGVHVDEMARHFGYAGRTCVSQRRRMMGLPARTRGRGTGKTGGWRETITLREFAETEMARLMAEEKKGRMS